MSILFAYACVYIQIYTRFRHSPCICVNAINNNHNFCHHHSLYLLYRTTSHIISHIYALCVLIHTSYTQRKHILIYYNKQSWYTFWELIVNARHVNQIHCGSWFLTKAPTTACVSLSISKINTSTIHKDNTRDGSAQNILFIEVKGCTRI